MSLVIISDATKRFGAELVFAGVNFRIEHRERIGLVGPNGAGKSTLLNLIAGRITPDEGEVSFARGLRLGYLTQMPDFQPTRTLREEMLAVFDDVHSSEAEMAEVAAAMSAPDAMADPEGYQQLVDRYASLQERFEHGGGYTVESRVQEVLDGLDFTREQQNLPATRLSGGQQTRASLGKLLLQSPDILLLDEPTNHLDLAALEWLENYLLEWHGSVVVVAHDRYFLDRVAQRIIEVDNHRAEEYPGNYSNYIQLREERHALHARQFESQQEQIARTEEFIRRNRAGQRAKEARGRQKQLDRLDRVERPYHAPELHFRMQIAIESGEIVLTTQKAAIGYSKDPLIRLPDNLMIERGDRIGLLGPNGSGKTTLLRTLIGDLEPVGGTVALGHNVRVGYYAQTHEGLNPTHTVVDEIRGTSAISEEAARTFLGRFQFTRDDVFKPIGVLSGGERARVALAKLTLMGANFLILDEPTNHLDLPAREFLESVLADYDGTVLFVSHDRYFIDAIATRMWIVEDGGVRDIVGNYTSYRKFILAEAARAQSAAKASQRAAQTQVTRQRVAATQTRTLAKVEAEVAAAETRTAQLEAAINDMGMAADYHQLAQLAEDYAAAKAQLDDLYAEWEQMAS
ncbi:MAG: ABC-F family ATP-binding cassette domain-containing protein [Ktedonobacterales bacterium]|nr:ABC-F family ATP-binding cassette domain-containing protein [Ktedonobacterales bacterium]